MREIALTKSIWIDFIEEEIKRKWGWRGNLKVNQKYFKLKKNLLPFCIYFKQNRNKDSPGVLIVNIITYSPGAIPLFVWYFFWRL